MTPISPTTLHGQRCRLRTFRPEDAAFTLAWRQDEATRDAMLGYRGAVDASTEAKWVAAIIAGLPDSVSFAISAAGGDDRILGYARLMEIDRASRHANFGIVIGAAADRGKGIGREATALMLRHAFDTLGLNRVYLRVLAENAHAIAVYRRLGFVEEGRLREQEFRGGRLQDVLVMGLLARERALIDAALR